MLVSRIFVKSEDAISAVDELKQIGFGSDRIKVVDKSDDAIKAEHVTAMGVSDETRAHTYAEGVNQGQTLVIVDAPLGTTAAAKAILERPPSGDEASHGTAYEEPYVRRQEDDKKADLSVAAPLSSWLNWPVLLDNPTPLSSWLNWRTLSAPPTEKATSHGLPFLSNDPTPLSSRFGFKVLFDNPAPFSLWLGRKTLSDDPTPLSSRTNSKVLLDNPTPLSSWLNLPVLSGEKTTKS